MFRPGFEMCIGLVSSELQSSGTPLALPTHRSIRAGRTKGTYYSLFLFCAINYKKAGVAKISLILISPLVVLVGL